MKRPMTRYRSGIVERTVRRGDPRVGCGKPQPRVRTYTGIAEQVDAAVAEFLTRTVYCIPCWRKAGRPA